MSAALVASAATGGGLVDGEDVAREVRAAAPGPGGESRRGESRSGESRSGDDKRRANEARLKAAFLFHFLKYAEFPADAFDDDEKRKKKAPLVLLVVGDDPFGDALESTFEGKEIGGRAIVLRRREALPEELDAHLVFTKGLDDEDEADLIELSRDEPCLLVGDDPGFAERGGFINFYMEKRKPRFEINVSRQDDTGVELSASLLKLAKVVEEEEPEERKKKDEKGRERDGAPRDGAADDEGGPR